MVNAVKEKKKKGTIVHLVKLYQFKFCKKVLKKALPMVKKNAMALRM